MIDIEDHNDRAARWALSQPHLAELMRNTYVTYDTTADAQRFAHSEEFRQTLHLLARAGRGPYHNYRLLDAGAGNGIASYAFAVHGYQVTAVDVSPSNLVGTKAAQKLIGLNGVAFATMVGHIPEAIAGEGQFDIIYGRQFFHHITELKHTVKCLSDLLAPGGILCAMREPVIWNEKQRQRFLATHPLQHITLDEGAHYLKEYRTAFHQARLTIQVELSHYDSLINMFPSTWAQFCRAIDERLPKRLRFLVENRHIGNILYHLAARYVLKRSAKLYSFLAIKPPVVGQALENTNKEVRQCEKE